MFLCFYGFVFVYQLIKITHLSVQQIEWDEPRWP